MGIDTQSVLQAARTKWNFLDFSPGLVGGHCIGIDPYYLTYKADQLGYHSQVILSGRQINDNMGKYIAENILKILVRSSVSVRDAKIVILGFTFKENCPDSRNTKVIDIIEELREYCIEPIVADPVADPWEAGRLYGITFTDMSEISDADAVVIAVAHQQFTALDQSVFDRMFGNRSNDRRVLIDVKGILNRNQLEKDGYIYWRL